MDAPKCPIHKINMVVKTAKGGKYEGQRFYVCPMYPNCKKNIRLDLYFDKTVHFDKPSHIKTSSTSEGKNTSPEQEKSLERIRNHKQDSLKKISQTWEAKQTNLQKQKEALIRRKRITF